MFKKTLFVIVSINVLLLLIAHALQLWYTLGAPRGAQMELPVWDSMKTYMWLSLAGVTCKRVLQVILTLIFANLGSHWEGYQGQVEGLMGTVFNMQNETVASIVYYMAYLIPYHAGLVSLAFLILDECWADIGKVLMSFLYRAFVAVLVILVARDSGVPAKRARLAAVLILSSVVLMKCLFDIFGAPYVLLKRYERFVPGTDYTALFAMFTRLNFTSDRVVLEPGSNSAYLVGVGKRAVLVVGKGLLSMGLTAKHVEATVAQALIQGGGYHFITETVMKSVLDVMKIVLLFYVVNRPGFLKSFGFPDKAVPFAVSLILLDLFSMNLEILFSPLWNYLNWWNVFNADIRSFKAGYGPALYEAIYQVGKRTRFANAPLMNFVYGLYNSHQPTYSDRVFSLGPYVSE